MKYLLSDGSTTTITEVYIIDAFSTRVKLYFDSIPKSSNNGLDRTYPGVDNSVIEDTIKYNLVKIAASISSKLSVSSIETKLGSFVVNIRLGDMEDQLTL